MLIFLYGKDTFRSRAYLKEMIEGFKQKRDATGLNIVKIDCEKNKESALIWNEIVSTPFLAEKKMVVLENFFSAKISTLRELFLEKIKRGFFGGQDGNVVIIWDALESVKTKAEKELFELLAKEPYSKRFETMKENELASWLIAEAKKKNGNIERNAAFFIAKNVKDIWQASSLLCQLLDYVNGGLIDEKTARLFLEERADDNIFNLVDAILAKNSKSAYLMISEQYKIGEDAQFVFVMLLRQCRILLEIKDLLEREGKMASDIMAKILKLHPFVVKKSLGMANRYSLNQLKDFYKELLDFEINTKTGRGGQSLLLDVLVGKMAI